MSVSLDVTFVEQRMAELGLSRAATATRANLSDNTIRRVCDGNAVSRATATALAEALGCEPWWLVLDVNDPTRALLADANAAGRTGDPSDAAVLQGWSPERPVSDWRRTVNGLSYRVYRMRYSADGRTGRGKRYSVADLADDAREDVREKVLRHPDACLRLSRCAHFPRNFAVVEAAGRDEYWVVDEWPVGETLESLLRNGPLATAQAQAVAVGLAEALRELHSLSMVAREFNPTTITVTDSGDVVLTDLELAKLLDGAPTVSPPDALGWPCDGYRAPELGGPDVGIAADLYSWGRVVTRVLLDRLPEAGREADALSRTALAPGAKKSLLRCLDPRPSQRPKDIGVVLRSLKHWA